MGVEGSPVGAQFGRNLRSCRKQAELSQEELGRRASLHRTEVGLLERGERVPRIDTLIKLASALSVQPEALLGEIRWEPDRIQQGMFKSQSPREASPT